MIFIAPIFLLLLSSLISSKIAYLIFFHKLIGEQTSFQEILRVTLSSFRFDTSVASLQTLLIIVPYLLADNGRFFPKTCRAASRWLFIALLVGNGVSAVIDINYFAYYQHRFHVFLWEFFQDWENSRLVIHSLRDSLSVQPTVFLLIGTGLITVLAHKASKTWKAEGRSLAQGGVPRRLLSYAFVFIALAAGARSTLGLPLAREASQGLASRDAFLNQVHSNPYYALYDAYREQHFWWTLDPKYRVTNDAEALQTDWQTQKESLNLPDLKITESGSAVQRLVQPISSLKKRPKKIVLVTAESLNGWPLDDAELRSEVDGGLSELRENGYSWTNYVPAGSRTYSNNLKIVLGLPTPADFPPETFLPEGLSGRHATAPKFLESMGIKTSYIYGGSLAWHHIGYVMERLGFSEVLGESASPAKDKARFGLHDDDSFQLALDVLDREEKQFVQVMTLSNHSPFELPASEYERPAIRYGENIKAQINDDGQFQKRYRAYRYSTESIVRFINAARSRPWFADTLFIITADHGIEDSPMTGLKTRTAKELLFERRIPLILYGPDILPEKQRVFDDFAGHLDLFPTIVSFLVDKPTVVPTFGRPLIGGAKSHGFLYGSDFTCSSTHCSSQGLTYRFRPEQKNLEECNDEGCKSEGERISRFRSLYDRAGIHLLYNPAFTPPKNAAH